MGCCLLNTKIFNLNVEIIILVISFQETEIKSYFNHPGGDVAIENEGKKNTIRKKIKTRIGNSNRIHICDSHVCLFSLH